MLSLDIAFSQYVFAWGRTLPSWLVVFLATYLIWLMLAAVLAYSRRVDAAQPRLFFIQAILAALGALAVNFIIGLIYFRLRPFAALDFNPLISVSPLGKSFPSDHAAAAWALAASFWPNYKKFRRASGVLLAAAALVALGRMLVGVHYFGDVLAGAAVGVGIAIIARCGFRRSKI